MKYLTSIILFALTSSAFCQISNIQTLQGQIIKKEDLNNLAEGSPYIHTEFTEGYLEFPEKVYKGVFIRYNTLQGKFELEKENGEVLELNTGSVLRIGFDRKRPDVYGIEMVSINNNWYQELIPNQFYKAYTTSIVEDAQPGYNTAERKKRFVTQEQYFISDENLNFTEIDLKKKEIIPIFKKKDQTIKYIKSERLKYNREEDVIQMLLFDRGN